MSTKTLYNAIAKSMLGRYAVYGVNLLSMMVLARLFVPETFGTVAAIAVFYTFFQLMAEAGLGPAIINLDQLRADDRDGLFGLTVSTGLLFGLIFYALAPVFYIFYQLPRIDEVVPYIAVSLVFFAASIVPNALLQREQAFFRIAHSGLVAELISTSAAITLLQFIEPLHALAAKTAFSAASSFITLFYFSHNTEFGQPRFGLKFGAIKPLLHFSAYQFGFNFINYFSRNLDNILVGKYMGAGSLGVYDKAYQLMRYPLMLLTFAMTPAIQPVIRTHAGNIDEVEKIHREFTFKLSLIGAVAGLLIFFFAEWIVLILLGNGWYEVTPIIKVLSIAIPVQVVLSTSGSFFQALNRTNLLFYSGCLSAIVMITAIVWGVYQKDLIVLTWGLVIAFHVNFLQAYLIMYLKIYKKGIFKFFIQKLPALLAILIMAGTLLVE